MKALLALELSADPSWLALLQDSGLRERSFAGERGRALFLEVDALLEEAGVRRRDLAGIVCGTGPGSYTGLRIGCAAARTLAFALGVPAAGVSSFAAAAMNAPQGSEVHLMADAHRGEVYHACFRRTPEGVAERQAVRVLGREEARAAVPDGALLIGDPALCATRPRILAPQVQPRASALLLLATGGRGLAGFDDATLPAPEPQYLRSATRGRPPRAGSPAG